MGEAIDRLIALSGREHVGAYDRTSATGKTVHVDAYMRSPGKMSAKQLVQAFEGLTHLIDSADTGTIERLRSKNQLRRISTEITARGGFKAMADQHHAREERSGIYGSEAGAATRRLLHAAGEARGESGTIRRGTVSLPVTDGVWKADPFAAEKDQFAARWPS